MTEVPKPSDQNYHPILVPTAKWKAFSEAMLEVAINEVGERERRERERRHDSERRDEGT